MDLIRLIRPLCNLRLMLIGTDGSKTKCSLGIWDSCGLGTRPNALCAGAGALRLAQARTIFVPICTEHGQSTVRSNKH